MGLKEELEWWEEVRKQIIRKYEYK